MLPQQTAVRTTTLQPPPFPIDELKSDIASIREEIRHSLDQQSEQETRILTEIETVKESVAAVQIASRETESHLAALQAEQEPEPTYTVTSGETSQMWNFRFDKTPLGEVYTVLGHHVGWSVALSPALEGEFSGAFTNADAEQAFAMVLKATNCSVDRRGDYVHVRPR